MSDVESKNFENADLITLVSTTDTIVKSVGNEVERGQNLYKNRHVCKTQSGKSNFLPVYKKLENSATTAKRSSVYFKLISRYSNSFTSKSLKPCKHFGNYVLNRDILTRSEHNALLSQPKNDHKTKRMNEGFYFVKKIYSPCTYRTEQLALPKMRKVIEHWNQYSERLTPQQSEYIARLLIGAKIPSITRAIELCCDEKWKVSLMKGKVLQQASLRLERSKKKILKEKKNMIRKISWNILIAMQEFLLKDQDPTLNQNCRVLANVIFNKLINTSRFKTNESVGVGDILGNSLNGLAERLAFWVHKITQVCNFSSLGDGVPTNDLNSSYNARSDKDDIEEDEKYESSSVRTECSASSDSEQELFESEIEFDYPAEEEFQN